MKGIVIAGGGGFIGANLSRSLTALGYSVFILTRVPQGEKSAENSNSPIRRIFWDGKNPGPWLETLDGASALINLSGESISAGRWNGERKKRILSSRLNPVHVLAQGMKGLKNPPGIWLQASATGFYGDRGEEILDESSLPGTGFLSEVVQQWESAALSCENPGLRRVMLRFGVVLAPEAGAFPRMQAPFRFFLGGPLGNGEQWLSWIHIRDLCAAIAFLLEDNSKSGIYNLTAPDPVQSNTLAKTLGKIMGRPSWLRVPGFVLKMMLGEMAEELLLSGCRVLPRRLLAEGFQFAYPAHDAAIRALTSSQSAQ